MDKLKFYECKYLEACVRFNKAEKEYNESIYNWYSIYQLGNVKNRWLRLFIMRSMKDKNEAIDLLNNLDMSMIGGQ